MFGYSEGYATSAMTATPTTSAPPTSTGGSGSDGYIDFSRAKEVSSSAEGSGESDGMHWGTGYEATASASGDHASHRHRGAPSAHGGALPVRNEPFAAGTAHKTLELSRSSSPSWADSTGSTQKTGRHPAVGRPKQSEYLNDIEALVLLEASRGRSPGVKETNYVNEHEQPAPSATRAAAPVPLSPLGGGGKGYINEPDLQALLRKQQAGGRHHGGEELELELELELEEKAAMGRLEGRYANHHAMQPFAGNPRFGVGAVTKGGKGVETAQASGDDQEDKEGEREDKDGMRESRFGYINV